MKHDFDTQVDRTGTASAKWEKYSGRDIIPMWVADMDFVSPNAIIAAMQKRTAHGVFGYTMASDELIQVVLDRLKSRYAWDVDASWLVWLPGVITGLNLACRSVGEDGDEVLTATPAYYPFMQAPENSRRQLVTVPMDLTAGCWRFDFERLEQSISSRASVLLLCNPFNPLGRVLSKQELAEISRICLKHDLVICSDEIHSDLILDTDKVHTPTATLSREVAEKTITLFAPSKTFNLPGLSCAVAVIANAELRNRFKREAQGIVPHVNILGYAAAHAAYSECDDWLTELLDYLRGNRDYLEREIESIAGLRMSHVEATYLAWIDTSATELPNPTAFFESAGVGVSDGARFAGPGYVRLNFGCSRSTLQEAVERIKSALSA
jgi:cystathionine beta-lyase|tara:strand:+ start:2074 stop:3213 length:1140 start_codon:yes stop_codon:yes gene_type:complete